MLFRTKSQRLFSVIWLDLSKFSLFAERLPFSIRVLLESAVRNCDDFQILQKDVESILDWQNSQDGSVEIPFKPARVILQDFT